jgi:glycosyltransferase involved in cell wall biosynthesis
MAAGSGKRRMRLVILSDHIPPREGGGAGLTAFEQARALAGRGHEVTVITTSDRQIEPLREESRAGVRIFSLRSRYPEALRSWFCLYNPLVAPAVRNLLDRLRPDIVHAHNLHRHLSFHTLTSAKATGARLFLTAHDAMLFHYGKFWEFIPREHPFIDEARADLHLSEWRKLRRAGLCYNPFRTAVIRRRLAVVDRVLAVSGSLRAALEANGISNVEVCHVGRDASLWMTPPLPDELRHFINAWNLQGSAPVLLAARLNRLKGATQAVKILKAVRKKIPHAVLLVLGRGPGLDEMRRLAGALGIAEALVTPGWLEPQQARLAYYACRVAIVPSLYLDPFPAVCLEAMAAARPVVGTSFGGTKEMVVDGETGFIANPFDVEGFAARIIELLADADLAAEFGRRGRERFERFFTMEKFIDRLLACYAGPAVESRT